MKAENETERKDGWEQYDWESVKAAYIVGHDTLEQLASRFHLSKKSVWKHSAKEGWVAGREEYRKRVAGKAIQQAEEKDVLLLTVLLESVGLLADQIREGLIDSRQMHRHLVSEPDGAGGNRTVEKDFQKVDWQAVRAAVQSLASATSVARDLLGIRSRQQEAEYQLQLQKLEILRAKAALGESDEDGTGIIFMPSVSEELSPPEEVTEDEEQQ